MAPWPLSVVCLLCSVLESYYPLSCEKNFTKNPESRRKNRFVF